MRKRFIYKPGDVINGCLYLRNIIGNKKHPEAEFLCICGKNKFITQLYNVISGNTRSCGCYKRLKAKHDSLDHGMCGTRVYKIWANIINRCTHPGYVYYHDKGISMCEEWYNSFQVFYAYVIVLPNAESEGYTLDRIDSTGNYEPGNVKWSTNHEQAANRNLSHIGSSGYTGIQKYDNRWVACITINRKRIGIGSSAYKSEALRMRNDYIMHHLLFEYPIQEWRG